MQAQRSIKSAGEAEYKLYVKLPSKNDGMERSLLTM